MDCDQTNYQSKYSEHQLLGRGNYGSAYIVQSNVSGKLFVAKKMQLDGLTEKEIQSTQGEIDILKKFSDANQYPFIVKYNQNFSFDRNLIIIMEFCEYGDLSGFLRNAKRKNQLLDQKVIIAWFIMLVMGIQALHSKNVLHRDLKSANIFLTSNKFIKIGDFGISKILDSTSAKTFVGTPYYLSPQICSNKPYEYSSDIWSLGCILYQLCTLNYPFQANNILNLALKITSEEVVPISSKYSKQLNEIVMGLLNKDSKKRMTIEDVLKTPYIQKFMQENGDKIDKICENIPLKKTVKLEGEESGLSQQPSLKEKQSAEDTMKTIQSNFQKTNNSDTFNLSKTEDSLILSQTDMISPTQKMKERKLLQADRKGKEMANEIKNSAAQRKFATLKKKQELSGSGSNFGKNLTKTLQQKYSKQNKAKIQEKKRGFNFAQTIDPEYISQMTQKMRDMGVTNNHDERIIPSLEKTIEKNPDYKVYLEKVESEEEDQYEPDFEEYIPEDIEEEDKEQIEAVTTFMNVVSGNTADMSPTKKAQVEKTFVKNVVYDSAPSQKRKSVIQKCVYMVGKQRFQLLYELVSKCYSNNVFTETKQLQALRKMGSASEKQVLQLIDEIKYYETLN